MVVLVLVLGWMVLRSSGGLQLEVISGKTVVLKRGDLIVPIQASGSVEPKDRLEIKSEAAGTVIATPIQVGQIVKEGDLLVKLDPKDEQRMVDITNKALAQAKIHLQIAERTVLQREYEVASTQSRLEQAQADLDFWEWKYEKVQRLTAEGARDAEEHRLATANYNKWKAQVEQLRAELQRAENNIALAKLDIQQKELGVNRVKDDLADAEERLSETRILAPTDGMLSKLPAKRGMVIVSGSKSLTGGTSLAVLADVSEFYVRALVDEADIGRVLEIAPCRARPGSPRAPDVLASPSDDFDPIEAGTQVQVTVEAFPEEEFQGVIDLIEPEAEKGHVVTSYVVRIRLTSENSAKLLIGMQASVEFVSESVKEVVLVPNEAVHYIGGQRGVYLQVESKKVRGKKVPEFKPFRAGLDNGIYTQAVQGLAQGDVVYVRLPRDPERGMREVKEEK